MAFPPEPRTRFGKAVAIVAGCAVILWTSVDAARQVERNRTPMDPEQLAKLAEGIEQAREDSTRGRALSTLRFAGSPPPLADQTQQNEDSKWH